MVLVYYGRCFIINGFNRKFIIMPYSTCCGAETDMTEIGICPECLEHCDWEEEDEEDVEADKEADNQIAQAKIDKYEK